MELKLQMLQMLKHSQFVVFLYGTHLVPGSLILSHCEPAATACLPSTYFGGKWSHATKYDRETFYRGRKPAMNCIGELI